MSASLDDDPLRSRGIGKGWNRSQERPQRRPDLRRGRPETVLRWTSPYDEGSLICKSLRSEARLQIDRESLGALPAIGVHSPPDHPFRNLLAVIGPGKEELLHGSEGALRQ